MATITQPIPYAEVLAPSPISGTRTQNARNHLSTLDGLRGLAALSVLAVHVFGEMHLQSTSSRIPLDQIVPHVHLAVDFFFMLSGFVIAKAYEAKLVTSMSFSRFVSIRLKRLYPMIFIGVALGTFSLAIRVAVTHSPSVAQLLTASLSALAILPTTALLTVFPGELFPIDFPQWSLLFELLINVVYAAIVRWLSTPKLMAICAISFVLLCQVAASSPRMLDVGMGLQPVGIIPADVWCGFIRVSFPFFIGIILFRYRLPGHTANAASILLSLVFLVVLFVPALRHSWTYEVFAVSVIFPVILTIGATCQPSRTLHKLFLFLGELSYPLYITHNPVTKIFINALNMLHIKLPGAIAATLCCLLAIGAAMALLKLWDQPVRNWLAGKGRQPAPKQHSMFWHFSE